MRTSVGRVSRGRRNLGSWMDGPAGLALLGTAVHVGYSCLHVDDAIVRTEMNRRMRDDIVQWVNHLRNSYRLWRIGLRECLSLDIDALWLELNELDAAGCLSMNERRVYGAIYRWRAR